MSSSTTTSSPASGSTTTSSPAAGSTTTSFPAAPRLPGGLGKDKSFKFTVPRGWQDVTSQVTPNAQIQVAYASKSAMHNFRINLNVTETTTSYEGTAQEATNVNIANEKKAGARIKTLPSSTLDNEISAGFLMLRTVSGTKLAQTQYFAVHNKKLYIATMSSAPQDVASANAYLRGIMTSWKWTS